MSSRNQQNRKRKSNALIDHNEILVLHSPTRPRNTATNILLLEQILKNTTTKALTQNKEDEEEEEILHDVTAGLNQNNTQTYCFEMAFPYFPA